MPTNPADLVVNGRAYQRPDRPVVVICLDGSEPGYIEAAIAAGVAPNLDRILKTGTNRTALSVVPTFTNPNNLSIVTGRPPSVHGISGNFFYDREAGVEVMMNDAKFLRVPTIFATAQQAGLKIAVVTAKDKLRTLLGKGLDFASGTAIAFSSEKADQATKAENGIEDVLDFVGLPLPNVYSADLSEFIFAAGVKLLDSFRPDLMYLSTTDYVQHKAAPGAKAANDFYAMFDRYVGQLDAAGCTIVITADHGMNDKHDSEQQPDVIYLQDVLDAELGAGTARVILPITDPYVAHHGALGSFATVYVDADKVQPVIDAASAIEGVTVAIAAAEAGERFELPIDRIGDVVVICDRHKVLGTTAARHDFSGLTEPLRSHGGLTEQTVPLISNRPTEVSSDRVLRNFDAFDMALNLVR
ncbi:phosphonoacetate hydrolase [Sphingopyxis sp. LC81]|uniref:phosphonoacetate hydrolase n=1 Tax=Sphingopyxis sp. LC81 TaxID=1502850 RepID=UPI0005691E1B|nr:phosphonoacetate hydrolase [Sphingopyxis sp. LC81]